MNIVAIGGGTGLSSLLSGLKRLVGKSVNNLYAIVTVADSGGSTGKLRKIYNIPAPGDIRNCIVALSENEEVMKKLFQHRLKGDGLENHAFGNLFLTALTEITGSFIEAVKLTSKILDTKGSIIPSTTDSVNLIAKFSNGAVIQGEEEITNYGKQKKAHIVDIWIEPENPFVPIEAIAAIESADIIIFGPGSLYTSIIPNLLIKEIKDSVKNSPSKKIFICNVMTQPGETDDYTAYDHINMFRKFTGIEHVDIAIVNTKMPPNDILKKYIATGQEPVVPDVAKISKENIDVYAEDLISENISFVRHDPIKLTNLLEQLMGKYVLY